MSSFKRTVVAVVLMTMLSLFLSKSHVVLADQEATTKVSITEHDPQGSTAGEIDSQKKSGFSWLWVLLGIAVVSLVAVAASSSSGDSGGGGGGDTGEPTGNFHTTW